MSAQRQKILVPLDGSKNSFRALSKAIVLAEQIDAGITGIFVIQSNPSELQVIKNLLKSSRKKLYQNIMKKAGSLCRKHGVDFIDTLEYGHEGDSIVTFAQKNNFDFIMIGSRGFGSVKEFFMGSTSNYVMHNSKIPVVVVK